MIIAVAVHPAYAVLRARLVWRERNLPEREYEYQQIFDRLQDEFFDYLARKSRGAFVQEMTQGEHDSDGNT